MLYRNIHFAWFLKRWDHISLHTKNELRSDRIYRFTSFGMTRTFIFFNLKKTIVRVKLVESGRGTLKNTPVLCRSPNFLRAVRGSLVFF